jgi:Family of unknown function (DUF6884)
VVEVIREGAGVLVLACGAAKADHSRPAMDLYTGSLFRAARRAAQADGRPWLICSAEYGLVDPRRPLDPYERALADTEADVARLGGLIAGQRHLLLAAAGTGRELGVEVWAPARYTAALRAGGVDVHLTPLAGLGLGAQIGWLTRHAHACEDYHERTGTRPGLAADAGWLQADHGLVYGGSISSQHGQPVVDVAEGRWVDDGSLLGRTYLNVCLANGVQLSDVRPTSLTPATGPVDVPAPLMAHPPTRAAALPAARTTPTAARGPAIT